MAVSFKRGYTTGPGDLGIIVKNSSNTLIDPFRLEYAVYDCTTGVEVLIGPPVCVPLRASIGNYYPEVMIMADGNVGRYLIRWTLQEYNTSPVSSSVEEFQVLGDNMVPSFTGDINLDKLIYSLRIMLRDNSPDRNYSIHGDESVELKVDNEEVRVSLQDLWELLVGDGLCQRG